MESFILTKEIDGTIKGHARTSGSVEGEYNDKGESASPTITDDYVIVTGVVQARQTRGVVQESVVDENFQREEGIVMMTGVSVDPVTYSENFSVTENDLRETLDIFEMGRVFMRDRGRRDIMPAISFTLTCVKESNDGDWKKFKSVNDIISKEIWTKNRGEMSIRFCPTDAMNGDCMTKQLVGEKFEKFSKEIMNWKV